MINFSNNNTYNKNKNLICIAEIFLSNLLTQYSFYCIIFLNSHLIPLLYLRRRDFMKLSDLVPPILAVTISIIWAIQYYKSHKHECHCKRDFRNLFFTSIGVLIGTIILFVIADIIIYIALNLYVIWLLLIMLFAFL